MRESTENVANHLRQGYGGQDVEVLLMTMLPIANERKTAMKKMMMAIGCALIAFGGLKLMQYLAVKLKVSSTRKRRKKRKGK